MPSSINISPAPVPAAVLKARYELADQLEKMLANDTPWYEFESPSAYRKARREGLNGFKKPVLNERARSVTFAARDGYDVELRVIAPSSKPSKGTWLHFHAGEYRSASLKHSSACVLIDMLTDNRWLCYRIQCLIRHLPDETLRGIESDDGVSGISPRTGAPVS